MSVEEKEDTFQLNCITSQSIQNRKQRNESTFAQKELGGVAFGSTVSSELVFQANVKMLDAQNLLGQLSSAEQSTRC